MKGICYFCQDIVKKKVETFRQEQMSQSQASLFNFISILPFILIPIIYFLPLSRFEILAYMKFLSSRVSPVPSLLAHPCITNTLILCFLVILDRLLEI